MEEKYVEDLREIKDIMTRTTRFISLSGVSGISTGIIALAGAFLAYQTIFKEQNYLVHHAVDLNEDTLGYLLLISLSTLFISIGATFFFTHQKTQKQKHMAWDVQTQRLLVNLAIPLITGGILCLILLFKGFVGMLPPLSLIFYGMALVNGSKYTLTEIRSLGLIEILLGLSAFQFIEYGLIFWALGFGLIQIIYGFMIERKYKL